MSGLGFAVRFYLGLGAPASRARFPECAVRVAAGYSPCLMRTLLAVYLGKEPASVGTCVPVKPTSVRITHAETGEQFFFKECPRRRRAHDVERALRISRVDRAWRAAHLLPRAGLNTPAPVGTAQRRDARGAVTEYFATQWLEGGVPFPVALATASAPREALLREFAGQLRLCHHRGIYSRDFVKNVLVREAGGTRRYWLTDLDGLHPLRRITRRRILFHMRQLAHYCPLSAAEADIVCQAYLGATDGDWANAILSVLRHGSAEA